MTKDPYRTESYQETMGLALAQASVDVACKMIVALGNRGALDLTARDDEGRNVVERFCEHAALSKRMIETIDLMGGRWAWAKPHEGHFVAMELQKKWIGLIPASSIQHSSHRIGAKRSGETLAYMIAHVDEQWLGLDRDGGAAAVAGLIARGADGLDCVQVCWGRGVDIHARLEDGTLAVAQMATIKSLNTWMTQGGDIHSPVNIHGSLPMWRHTAANLQLSSHVGFTNEIRKSLKGLVDEQELNDECLFLEAWHERSNHASMLSHLVSIRDWHQARRPDGTPVWLAALAARPELLENFLTRKRARPDFTQRDHRGRSAWYAMMGAQNLDTIRLMGSELPLHEYGRDMQGRGLLRQVIDDGGGLVALGEQNQKLQTRLSGVLRVLDEADDRDKAAVLDGLDGAYLAGLDAMPIHAARCVAAKLFASRTLLQKLEPEAVIAMGQMVVHERITDEKGSSISNGMIQGIIDNMEWAARTHGTGFPKEMREWLEGIASWDDAGLCPIKRKAAPVIRPMIAAIVEQAQMHEQVVQPAQEPARPRGMRF